MTEFSASPDKVNKIIQNLNCAACNKLFVGHPFKIPSSWFLFCKEVDQSHYFFTLSFWTHFIHMCVSEMCGYWFRGPCSHVTAISFLRMLVYQYYIAIGSWSTHLATVMLPSTYISSRHQKESEKINNLNSFIRETCCLMEQKKCSRVCFHLKAKLDSTTINQCRLLHWATLNLYPNY